MKKEKPVKILYTVYPGTPFWDAIVKNPIPNTTRLHEIVSRGLMTIPEFSGSRELAAVGLAWMSPGGGNAFSQEVRGKSGALETSRETEAPASSAAAAPSSPFDAGAFDAFDNFGGAAGATS
jgi:hypothetical protein